MGELACAGAGAREVVLGLVQAPAGPVDSVGVGGSEGAGEMAAGGCQASAGGGMLVGGLLSAGLAQTVSRDEAGLRFARLWVGARHGLVVGHVVPEGSAAARALRAAAAGYGFTQPAPCPL